MKRVLEFATKSLVTGLLVVIPLYLAVLLLLKAMKSVLNLVKPIARLLGIRSRRDAPVASAGARDLLPDRHKRPHCDRKGHPRPLGGNLFGRIPGYSVIRSLTQQLAGSSRETAWQPAFVEIEDALVPAFIIEEVEGDRYTVFVPSIPTLFRRGLRFGPQTRSSPGRAFHGRAQNYLQMGIGF